MRTTRLPTVCASVATRCLEWTRPKGPMSGGGGAGLGTLYSEVQFVMVTWGPPNRMTDNCESITFSQIRWRAVIKYEVHMIDIFQTYSRTFGSICDEYLWKQSNTWHHEIT